MRCPQCKFIIAEFFKTCPECGKDVSDLAELFGPFPEISANWWDELFQVLEEPFEDVTGEETTVAIEGAEALLERDDILHEVSSEASSAASLEDLVFPEEDSSEDLLEELDTSSLEASALDEEVLEEIPIPEERDLIEELPEIELDAQDLEGSPIEELESKDKDEEELSLELFEEIEGLEEIISEDSESERKT
ncbi:zinc ribbon domain-containing protein [Thermodesulfatator atlanticus]|uniref:zinc ribbon domain-containing protein n=1 Tax=Thermodesulfatator atlanticus TaxID=501497 RepID=UPI0003B312B6|nr:zinc ribbon domain-containing protein [Thermodesulfatator atlanticus]